MFSRKKPETEDRKMSDLPDDLGIPMKPARPPGQTASVAPLGRTPTPHELAHYREFLIRITLIVQAIVRRHTLSSSPTLECRALPSTHENPRSPMISKVRDDRRHLRLRLPRGRERLGHPYRDRHAGNARPVPGPGRAKD